MEQQGHGRFRGWVAAWRGATMGRTACLLVLSRLTTIYNERTFPVRIDRIDRVRVTCQWPA